jgi:hypothetical protein
VDTKPIDVLGIAFRTDIAGGGTALKITAPSSPYVTGTGVLLQDVDARGFDVGADYWDTSIHLVNAWYPSIIRPSLAGKDNTFDQADGIIFEDCQAPHLRDPVIFHLEDAISAVGSTHGEGMNFAGGEIVGVKRGIYWNIGVFKPCIGIHDMHINASLRCMILVNVGQVDISGLSLYKTQTSAEAWQGADLTNCYGCKISHIIGAHSGVTAGTGHLITLTNSSDNTIDDVMGEEWYGSGNVVLLAGTSDGNKIRGVDVGRNSAGLTPVGKFALTGLTNVFRDIEVAARTVFTNLDATPSVANDVNGEWQTGNTGATNVTFFDDGLDGQRIKILFNDANTTIIFSGGMITKGFVNVAVPNGGIMEFRNEGGSAGLWREESRNF